MQSMSRHRLLKNVTFFGLETFATSRTFRFRPKWRGFRQIMATQKRPSVPRKSLPNPKPWEDEVLHEVYTTRDAYAAEHGYDLDRIYADLKYREANSRLRRANEGPLARA